MCKTRVWWKGGNPMGAFILCVIMMGYMFYTKHSETKQIEAVGSMDWLTFEEIKELIIKVKE